MVVGGAAESLESAPGTMEITLCHRRGFVRQALLYGACVVPSVGFGETDVFETSRSEFMLKIQKKLQKALGFAIPLFHGRGVFQKAFGLLPFRRPVRVVIGRPIDPEVIDASLAKKARENGEEWLHQDVDGRQLVERVGLFLPNVTASETSLSHITSRWSRPLNFGKGPWLKGFLSCAPSWTCW